MGSKMFFFTQTMFKKMLNSAYLAKFYLNTFLERECLTQYSDSISH